MRKLLWESIKVSSEFKKITTSGKKIHTPFFIYFRSPSKDFKLGVVASKKVGCAVERNRAKRLLRSAFSQLYKYDKSTTVIIAKPSILTANYCEIVESMRKISTIELSNDAIKCQF